jgi:hypothetical protein
MPKTKPPPDPFAPPSRAAPPSDDPDGDALVADVVAARAHATALGGAGLGLLAAAAAAVPLSGATLPALVYGVFSFGPLIVGAVAVAAGLSAARKLFPADAAIRARLAPRRAAVLAIATAAVALGALGAAGGLAGFVLFELRPTRPMLYRAPDFSPIVVPPPAAPPPPRDDPPG